MELGIGRTAARTGTPFGARTAARTGTSFGARTAARTGTPFGARTAARTGTPFGARSSKERNAIRGKERKRSEAHKEWPIKSIAIGRRGRPRRGAKPARGGRSKAPLWEEEGRSD